MFLPRGMLCTAHPYRRPRMLTRPPRPPAPRQMHHLLNNGAEVNQRDDRGFTALHRAAYLAHYDGYLELYEYLLVGAGRWVLGVCVGGVWRSRVAER